MNNMYKIQKYIPNFNAKINDKELIVDFSRNIISLAAAQGLTHTSHAINRIDILMGQDGDFGFIDPELATDDQYVGRIFNLRFDTTKQQYTLIDSLRDSLLILVGYDAELVNHNNMQDKEYLQKTRPVVHWDVVPDFEVQFNPPENRVHKPSKPKYYQSSFITTPYGRVTKPNVAIKPSIDTDEPYLYVNFQKPVRVATGFIHGMQSITAKRFGIHANEKTIFNEFSIFSYNDYLEKGLCLFKREAVAGSFFDLYDVFDALYILLYCIQGEDGFVYKYDEKYETDEQYGDMNDFPIEL